MDNPINNYFRKEKRDSKLFIIIGMVTFFAGVIMFVQSNHRILKGVAFPLLAVSAIELVVGGNIYSRTQKQLEHVQTQFEKNKIRIMTEESKRMSKILSNFKLYRWIEISILIAGTVIIILMNEEGKGFWKGLGIGMAVQASLLLWLDNRAEGRASEYINFLRKSETHIKK